MSLTRVFSLALRIGFGSAWAAVLMVLGMALVFGGLGLPPSAWRPAGGVAFMAAGTFIFMVVAADRLVPAVGVRQSMWLVEMGTAGVMFLACLLCVLLLASRGGGA